MLYVQTDKASMLDEVIEYLKQLQAQVQMINRMNNMSSLLMPLAMQQQLQMSSMMGPMAGIGMAAMAGIGMGVMDLNTISRAGIPPFLHPGAAPNFMPHTASWDINPGDRLSIPASVIPTDSLYAHLACQSQVNFIKSYHMLTLMLNSIILNFYFISPFALRSQFGSY